MHNPMMLTTLPRPRFYGGPLAPENHALAGDFLPKAQTMPTSNLSVSELADSVLEICPRSDLLIAYAIRQGYRQPEDQERMFAENRVPEVHADLALCAAVAWLLEQGGATAVEHMTEEARDIQAALEEEAASEGPATELQIREAEAREEERWEEEAAQLRSERRPHEDACPCSDCKARLRNPFI